MIYRALILDLNGVLIRAPLLSDRFNQDFSIDFDTFLPVLSEIMVKVRLPGAKSVYFYFQPYLESWGISMTKEEFSDYWYGAEALNREAINFLKKIKKKGFYITILSNNFQDRTEHYQANFPELEELVDKQYYSWQTGFIKPDPRAFKQILDDLNLQPSEVIYFDDSSRNVEAASQLGIDSHLFSSLSQIEGLLEG